MGYDALTRCVGDPHVFAAETWGMRPLLQAAGRDEGFDDLLSLDDVDRLVSSTGLRLPAFRLVKEGKTIPADNYTKTTRTGSQIASGVLDAPAVFGEFDDGATIVFQGMHRYWEPLALFCRELERGLGHPVQANAYVTPPGSRGLDPHEDEHDVFVLQTHGSKDWQVFDRHDLPPTLGPIIAATIRPGDALYIPKGFPHAASTQEQTSVHVTVGILAITWGAALTEVVKLLGHDRPLQEPLPLRFVDDAGQLENLVEERLLEIGSLITKTDPGIVAGRLRRRFLTNRQPVIRGQLHRLLALDEVTDDSMLRKRDGAICVLHQEEGELSVLLGDRELRMPARVEPAMRRIIERDSFTVRELSDLLDPPGRLVLVRRLIVEGLLEVAG